MSSGHKRKQPKIKPHFIAMSGSAGCLPEFCEVYDTFKPALDALCQMFTLPLMYRKVLLRDRYFSLLKWRCTGVVNAGGADYCQIVECHCDNPSVHKD